MSDDTEVQPLPYDDRLIECPECRSVFEAEDHTIVDPDVGLRAAVEAELGDEPCYVFRDSQVRCTILIGGRIGNSDAVFTREMCCLPCRVRAALARAPHTAAMPSAATGGER